jgi:hypothetical protein
MPRVSSWDSDFHIAGMSFLIFGGSLSSESSSDCLSVDVGYTKTQVNRTREKKAMNFTSEYIAAAMGPMLGSSQRRVCQNVWWREVRIAGYCR